MSDRPLNVGVVGYGYVSRVFHLPMIEALEGLNLTAIASTQAQKVREAYPHVKVFDSPNALFACPNIDLIVVASPNDTHFPLTRDALRAGHHVLVDKPFMLDLAQTRAILNESQKAKRHICVFQNRRWDSDFLGVTAALKRSDIGEVKHFASSIDYYEPTPADAWRDHAGAGSGRWFDLAPHMVDQALQLFGLPLAVTADLGALRSGAKSDDWFNVVLRYENFRVTLNGTMLAPRPRARFIINTDKATIIKRGSDPQEAQLRAGMNPLHPPFGRDDDETVIYYPNDRSEHQATPSGQQIELYRRLQNALKNESAMPVLPHEILGVMAVITAAYDAAKTGVRQEIALSSSERAEWT